MFTVAVFGAGKIGETIAALLTKSGRYTVKLCDRDLEACKRIAKGLKNASSHALDLTNESSTEQLLRGCDAVISALPFFCNPDVARLAVKVGVHYLDLTEDVETTRAVAALAAGAKVALMPQCGLAPGFISIAAHHLTKLFDTVETLRLRVGALPIYPSNRLRYNLTWSTEGLINEYCNMCEAVVDGKKIMIKALEGYETFLLDGEEFEAFNTSGGLGTLCDTLGGQVRNIDYKSIRYLGHKELIAFLIEDLNFTNDREGLKKIFERAIPGTPQDKVIIRTEAIGRRGNKLLEKTYASTVYNQTVDGLSCTAIQITTAAGICAPLDMLLAGALKGRTGFIKCEDISLTEFLNNEFGKHYRDEKALSGLQ